MESNEIISKVNGILHEATIFLAEWLEKRLSKTSESWWNNSVLPSLSNMQQDIAISKGFSKLSDFDLAALLRIADKSWYDLCCICQLSGNEREVMREMIRVRNNWAHCAAQLPGKDQILSDLKTIQMFLALVNGNSEVCKEVGELIRVIERPDSIATSVERTGEQLPKDDVSEYKAKSSMEISEGSTVSIISSPGTIGIVKSVKRLGNFIRYEVFVGNGVRMFYPGQIETVDARTEVEWTSVERARRYLTAYQINNPSSQNLYSLNAARIDFVPYQFRPALKLIHADEPRILIADSVGVGKTIEAGLIIKELEAREELERIVIICPRPLVAERKWELEMKRFDEDFTAIDGPMLRSILSDVNRDGEWPSKYNKVIMPYSILDSRVYGNGDNSCGFGLYDLRDLLHFDLVIVDEAHHIRNGTIEKEKAFAYKCTKLFCDHSDAVVMLTATPLQTGDKDLFTLLNLLRPDIIIDADTFKLMSRPNEYISRAVSIIRGMGEDWTEKATRELVEMRKTQWGDEVVAKNPLYSDIISRLSSEDLTREERVKLISDVESLHSFSTMINRTRRRDIQDFCVRRPHTISTRFTSYQQTLHDELLKFERLALTQLHDPRFVQFMTSMIKRQAASCIFGLAPYIRVIIERRLSQLNDDPDYTIPDVMPENDTDIFARLANRLLELADNLPDEDPKLDKMLEIVSEKQKQDNNKIMIFSTFRHTLVYLKKKLLERGYRVDQIDGSVDDERRYELKNRFETPKEHENALDILLFTEVGSEGLDYQFCDLMINYDLPWNPMRIEQRIGRIDRRGQQSEAVNIYNMITEDTVDADIYYRCLSRIGVFEKSIGECEEILGKIASEVQNIALDPKLTDEERRIKLEQVSDNEVRKAQELIRLEEEEKELFGFDLSEYTTSQEIKRAENPWLIQPKLQRLIESYLKDRIGDGQYILREGALKTLRLAASAKEKILEDLRKLPGPKNAQRRTWESYLKGSRPIQPITFTAETAAEHRDCMFITPMHPLVRQAAARYSENLTGKLSLRCYSSDLPAGSYPFSMYAWEYYGFNNNTRLVTICENAQVAGELPYIIETSSDVPGEIGPEDAWDKLEERHVDMWMRERDKHIANVKNTVTFRLGTISNTFHNKERTLERLINDTFDDRIKRMYIGELEETRARNEDKISKIKAVADRADIITTPLISGIITVVGE